MRGAYSPEQLEHADAVVCEGQLELLAQAPAPNPRGNDGEGQRSPADDDDVDVVPDEIVEVELAYDLAMRDILAGETVDHP